LISFSTKKQRNKTDREKYIRNLMDSIELTLLDKFGIGKTRNIKDLSIPDVETLLMADDKFHDNNFTLEEGKVDNLENIDLAGGVCQKEQMFQSFCLNNLSDENLDANCKTNLITPNPDIGHDLCVDRRSSDVENILYDMIENVFYYVGLRDQVLMPIYANNTDAASNFSKMEMQHLRLECISDADCVFMYDIGCPALLFKKKKKKIKTCQSRPLLRYFKEEKEKSDSVYITNNLEDILEQTYRRINLLHISDDKCEIIEDFNFNEEKNVFYIRSTIRYVKAKNNLFQRFTMGYSANMSEHTYSNMNTKLVFIDDDSCEQILELDLKRSTKLESRKLRLIFICDSECIIIDDLC